MLKRKNNVIKIFIWILLISLAFTNISSLNVAAETMETIETAETAESIKPQTIQKRKIQLNYLNHPNLLKQVNHPNLLKQVNQLNRL
jgi:hypothetical protein